ncbi:zinc finger, CCHC-type containing protein [Tanacetum coccineum]
MTGEVQVDGCFFSCGVVVFLIAPLRGLVKPLVLTIVSVAMYGLCDSMCLCVLLCVYEIVRVICEVFVDLKLANRQDLGFIPSGNVVLSSTYVGKILGADQLLVILCYRYQESGIGYWILSMTISGSGTPTAGVDDIHAFYASAFPPYGRGVTQETEFVQDIFQRVMAKFAPLEEALPKAPPATATVAVRNAYGRLIPNSPAEAIQERCFPINPLAIQAIRKGLKSRNQNHKHKDKEEQGQGKCHHFQQDWTLEEGTVLLLEELKKIKPVHLAHQGLKGIQKLNKGALDLSVMRSIFEIDMDNHVSNERSIYQCSNKKSKNNLDSTFLWHCHLGHINKKRIIQAGNNMGSKSIDDESFDVCVSCISGKMVRNPFTHASAG